MSNINFFTADKGYLLKEKTKIKKWINAEASIYSKNIEELNIVFCSDDYLLDLNKKYLNHFDLTDVITFDNSNTENVINGEIYISVDRVIENAKIFKTSAHQEFLRIIIHGSLHLFGFTDKTQDNRAVMTEKENESLFRLNNL